MAKDKTTLREFITELEKLADNGKNDNIPVVYLDADDVCYDIGWYGIKEVYPQEEIDECNPIHGQKCLVIQMC